MAAEFATSICHHKITNACLIMSTDNLNVKVRVDQTRYELACGVRANKM